MCGRYVYDPGSGRKRWVSFLDEAGNRLPAWIQKVLLAEAERELRNDIRPSQHVPVITGDHQLHDMQWWFVPAWAKDPEEWRRKVTTFNARVEGLTESRTYRNAWKAGRRCVLPMSGYYEWRVIDPAKPRAKKERNYLHAPDHRPLWVAGLWERWQHGDAEPLDSCTMITTEANPALAHIHDRSPVFIPDDALDDWLQAGADAAMALLQAIELPDLEAEAVDGPVAVG